MPSGNKYSLKRHTILLVLESDNIYLRDYNKAELPREGSVEST